MSAYKFLSKNGTNVAFLAVVVVFLLAVVPIISGYSAFALLPTEKQAFSEEGQMFNLGIYLSIALLILIIGVTLVFSIWQIISNPKSSIKGLIGFGVIAVLFLALYAITSTDVAGNLATTVQEFKITDNLLKVIGGGIQLSLVMLIGLVALAVILEIWNYFKNS